MTHHPLENEEIIEKGDQRSFLGEITFELDLEVRENLGILRWRGKTFQVKRIKRGRKIEYAKEPQVFQFTQ